MVKAGEDLEKGLCPVGCKAFTSNLVNTFLDLGLHDAKEEEHVITIRFAKESSRREAMKTMYDAYLKFRTGVELESVGGQVSTLLPMSTKDAFLKKCSTIRLGPEASINEQYNLEHPKTKYCWDNDVIKAKMDEAYDDALQQTETRLKELEQDAQTKKNKQEKSDKKSLRASLNYWCKVLMAMHPQLIPSPNTWEPLGCIT
jgi:hypothetical protein